MLFENWMPQRLWTKPTFLVALLCLAGCGQKGPLTLPDQAVEIALRVLVG